MNRLRTGGNARISFFSFQDIITSVTGILILVTLMLSFSVTTAETTTPEQDQLQAARQRLADAEAENERLQQRRREAATLPDQTQLRSQLASMRREQSDLEAQRKQLEASLQSAHERLQAQAAQKETTAAALREKIAALQTQLEDLRAKAAHSKTNVNVLYIIPDVDTRRNAKAPLALIVSGDRVRVQRLNGAHAQDYSLQATSIQSLLSRFNPERDLLVFYFRPSGVRWFDELRKQSRQGGFEIGYDAVEEEKEIVFSAQ